MKVKLEFDGYEEEEAVEAALNGYKYKDIIDDIWEKCFRPNNKHGYGNKLLDSEQAYQVIEALSEIYLKVKNGDI